MNKLRRSLSVGLLAGLPWVSFMSELLFTVAPAKNEAIGTGILDSARALDSGFAALIDTFVPADETPGAIDLGIDLPILARIRTNQEYLNVIEQVFDDLNALMQEQYEKRFEVATLAQRTDVVSRVLRSSVQYKNAKIQLSSLRTSTLSAFYSSEAAFEMLDYHPPSQGGYPDYARPPA